MSALKEWFISGAWHFALGFVVGWIVFKRPAWADALWQKIKSKIPFLKG